MPKYEEIANILRDRIASGVYPVDSMLPIQSELSKEFGVSRMTIKKAVEPLKDSFFLNKEMEREC